MVKITERFLLLSFSSLFWKLPPECNRPALRSAARHPQEAKCAFIPVANIRSLSHGVLQCCGTSLTTCLFRKRQESESRLPWHTQTHQSAVLFLNHVFFFVMFFLAQFQFPQCFTYAQDSGLPAFSGNLSAGLLAWVPEFGWNAALRAFQLNVSFCNGPPDLS